LACSKWVRTIKLPIIPLRLQAIFGAKAEYTRHDQNITKVTEVRRQELKVCVPKVIQLKRKRGLDRFAIIHFDGENTKFDVKYA
jgi:hypothetical protein